MAEPQPLRDKLRVRMLPQTSRSAVLVTPDRETPLRRCEILSIGPDVRELRPGMVVLANILSAQMFGEDLVLPQAAIYATLEG